MKFKDRAKTALSKVLSDLIQSDGIVSQGEIDYLRQVLEVLGISNTNLKKASGLSLSDAVRILKTQGLAEKTLLLHVIQQLAVADDDLAPSESMLVTAILLAIDLPTKETSGLQAELISIPDPDLGNDGTIVYIEPSFDPNTNASLTRQLKAISKMLQKENMELFYLPKVMNEIHLKKETFTQMLRYLEPLLTQEQLLQIDRDLKEFDTSKLSKELYINHFNARGFDLTHPSFLIQIGGKRAKGYRDLLILKIQNSPMATLKRFFKLRDEVLRIHPAPLDAKDQDYLNRLILSKSEMVKDGLRYTGFHKTIVDTILTNHSENGPTRIQVSPKGHIFLTDRNGVEVKIQALGRALYILYLRHPEGIALTELSDHRDELLAIYASTSSYTNAKKLEKTVDDLVDFVGETINPLLSRIRKAFVTLLGKQARAYLIEGKYGEKKAIQLDRKLVDDQLVS